MLHKHNDIYTVGPQRPEIVYGDPNEFKPLKRADI